MYKYLKDKFLNCCEIYGSKLSNWAWHLRWNKKTEIWKEDGKKHILKIIED
jgi:hypothetical protein